LTVVATVFITAICFSSLYGLSSSLVTKDLMEVCPLSRGMMLPERHPYPRHYSVAFAFSIFLCPHALRFAFQRPTLSGDIRVYHVPLEYLRGLGFAYLPEVPRLRRLSG
jgi:hypothetical protein